MDKTIYTSPECVICLDLEPVPYFMPCAHQCCCTACAEEIGKAKMTCPLCRCEIRDTRTVILEDVAHDTVVPIPEPQLQDFRQNRRDDYVAQLRGRVSRNALFVGKSKAAREWGKRCTDELQRRQQETAGGERCMTPRSKITMTVDDEQRVLHVEYKVGRKVRKETAPYCDWDELEQELREHGIPAALELAIDNPSCYWLVHYHKQGKVEDALQELRKRPRVV